MKKVLFVTTIDSTVNAFLVPHIRALIDQGYIVEIATNVTNPKKTNNNFGELKIFNVPFNRKPFNKSNLKAYKMIKKILKENKYDVIHVHTPVASFVTRVAANKKQKIIYTAHGFHFNENGKKLSNLAYYIAEKSVINKTTKLITINTEDYTWGLNNLERKKVEYIKGVGVDLEKYNPDNLDSLEKEELRKKLGIDKKKVVITHIAEFNNNKRQIDVVQACDILKEQVDDFVILLVGRGANYEYIRSEIESRGLGSHIKCLGYRNDVDKLLGITDIGLLVSIREGLPRSVMEMLAMGIPVIASNIRGNKDLIRDGKNGYLVNIKSPHEIASKCLKLINDKALRTKMSKSSIETVKGELDIESILEKLNKLYKELI